MGVPFEFLNARLRGRRRLVYEGEALRALTRVGSVEALARRLYPREGISGRLALERKLRQDCARELTFFLSLLPTDAGRFYRALVRRFQVDVIQVLLRLFAGAKEGPPLEEFVPRLPRPLALPVGDLMGSADVRQFCERLPRPLDRVAAEAAQLWDLVGSSALVEMALERAYWEEVTGTLAQLSGQWRPECALPLLDELRTARLVAVLRAARNYQVQWPTLLRVLPRRESSLKEHAGRELPDSVLALIHADPSAENVSARLGAHSPSAESIVELEESGWQTAYGLANRLYYGEVEGPAILVGYFYIRRHELKQLTALVETLHFGAPAGAPQRAAGSGGGAAHRGREEC